MKKCVKACMGELIVSCQAYQDTPMYGVDIIKKFVECALMGNAKAVRCCWSENIKAARETGNVVIIGINKATRVEGHLDGVFITPTFESAREIIEAGSDIVALDARILPQRGKKELEKLIREISDVFPEIGIMADCATFEEGAFAAECGADIIGTTLSGIYHPEMTGPDCELVRLYKEKLNVPVNAEGRIWELADINAVNEAGADMITIGTAITRPQLITERFVSYYSNIRK